MYKDFFYFSTEINMISENRRNAPEPQSIGIYTLAMTTEKYLVITGSSDV